MAFVAARSNKEHAGPLTWNGKPLPYMHLNARSRYIMREEILEVWGEEVNRW